MHQLSNVLVLGAGRSAGYLIAYLDQFCLRSNRKLTVCDRQFGQVREVFGISEKVEFVGLDVTDKDSLWAQIHKAEIVVSLLPPALHVLAAEGCLFHGRCLFTASYISPAMRAMDHEVKSKNLLFMNELGLDPGIDHLCVNAMMDELASENAQLAADQQWKLDGFESHCGGLVAASDSEGNPWKYKFSWNPTNVILAGQGGDSVFRDQGIVKRISWKEVFNHARLIDLPGVGVFDVYPNRDSLGYEQVYGMEGVETLIRGTLRRKGYCDAWQCLLESGLTSTEICFNASVQSPQDAFLYITGYENQQDWIAQKMNERASWDLARKMEVEEKLHFLRLTDNAFWQQNGLLENWGWEGKTAAAYLEKLLLLQWKLGVHDRDEVVMAHILHLSNAMGQKKEKISVMVVMGDGGDKTAMAKTVGLPLAMGVETYLEKGSDLKGVHLPWGKEWYQKLLPQLASQGVSFTEYERFS